MPLELTNAHPEAPYIARTVRNARSLRAYYSSIAVSAVDRRIA